MIISFLEIERVNKSRENIIKYQDFLKFGFTSILLCGFFSIYLTGLWGVGLRLLGCIGLQNIEYIFKKLGIPEGDIGISEGDILPALKPEEKRATPLWSSVRRNTYDSYFHEAKYCLAREERIKTAKTRY